MLPVEKRTCGYPGCKRPVAAVATGGRPSSYCSLPEHNRASAFRARQVESRSQDAAAEVEQRVLSMADARLRVLASELPVLLAAHREAIDEQVAAALESLDALGDPAAALAEVAAVKADGAEQVSRAEAEAQAQATAAARALEAATAAQERATVAMAERDAAVEAAAQSAAAAVELEATVTQLRDAVQSLRTQADTDAQRIVAAEQAAASATARAEAAERAATAADERADATIARAEQRLDAELARMQTRLDKAEAARSEPKKA